MLSTYLKTPFRLLTHPFNSYWDLKYEKTGRLKLSILFVLLIAIMHVLSQEFAGFLVNNTYPLFINSIKQLEFVFVPFFLWCIANWSLTTLMDGEGRFTEIIMATGYALIPMVIIDIPMIWISRILAIQETPVYYFFESFATFWFVFLLFIGTMTVHQFSVKKTIVTMLLTLVVILFILFVMLLFFSLIQQIVIFVETIYKEILFRT